MTSVYWGFMLLGQPMAGADIILDLTRFYRGSGRYAPPASLLQPTLLQRHCSHCAYRHCSCGSVVSWNAVAE